MNVRDYILQELKAFDISEAQLLDMSLSQGFNLDDEYNADTMKLVGVSIAGFIEKMVFAPKMRSVSESGFSISWDYDNIGKYYLWICQKWGLTPNKEVLGILGVSAITDKSDCW